MMRIGYKRLLAIAACGLLIGPSQVISVSVHHDGDRSVFITPFPGVISVNSFDVIPEGNRLHALVVGRFAADEPKKLAYLESLDAGQSWSSPQFIETGPVPVISSRGNDVRLAVSGNHRVAVFQIGGELPGNGPLRIAVSDDGGQHWQSGIKPVTGDTLDNQSYPDIQVDGEGILHLVWLDDREERGSTQGLRAAVSRDGGRHWIAESTIDDAVCTCCSTRLNRLPDRSLALLYRDHAPQDMRLALNRPAGDSHWRVSDHVGRFGWQFEGCPHTGGGLASVREGGQIILHAAVWTGEDRHTGLHYLRSGRDGQGWPHDLLIDANGGDPDIASLSPDHLAITYRCGQGKDSRIAFVESRDGGHSWSQTRYLSNAESRSERPRVAATTRGYRVFWTERTPHGEKRLALSGLIEAGSSL
jgi:hypothetical protein